jgi:AraC-like DNA-binding protein
MAIPALLKELGQDPWKFLQRFGTDPEYFENPDHTIASRTIGQILGQGAEVTGCEHFGLLVGERGGVQSLGPVGYLMLSSPTVGTALDLLSRSLRAHDRGGIVLSEHADGQATLGYAVTAPGAEHVDQMLAASLAIAMNILRGLCGAHWRPTEARCAFATPRDLAPYRKFFGLTPQFDSESTVLVFSDHWLQKPLPSADPVLHLIIQDRIRELLESTNLSLTGQLRGFLRAMVTTRRCSLESAAAHFGMPGRAFRRRLAAEGTTFRRIREEARFEAACQLLRDTRSATSEIAWVLGYADASAFTRSFSRQAGVGPAHWRATVSRDRQPSRGRTRRKTR